MRLTILIFLVILWWVNEIKAQTAKCDYSFRFHSSFGYKPTNTSHYTCVLDTDATNFDEKLIRIDGQHENEQNDDDVKFLTKYHKNEIKTISSIFCKRFPNLEVMRIDNGFLRTIDEDSLESCKQLKHLVLTGNRIPELPENLLIANTNLEKFYIFNNQLTTLPENLFLNQKELEELYLDENQINSLPSNIFHPLIKLEVLDLNNNKLELVNPEWFVNLQNLKWLGLSGNQISEVPPKCFESLKNLERLWIYENKINYLHPDSFDGLQSLQALSLFNNEISDLPANVFAPLKNLKELHLYNNKLTTIHSDSFSVHNKLTTIRLDSNKINSIDEKFIDNTAVSTFHMKNNICSQLLTATRSEIKPNLKKCFGNYQPRIQPELLSNHQSSTSNPNAAKSCGKSFAGQGNIIGGTHITRGSFPW